MAIEQKNVLKALILLPALCVLFLSSLVATATSRPIYNEHANARRDIAAAISQAGRTGKNVVLIFGANW